MRHYKVAKGRYQIFNDEDFAVYDLSTHLNKNFFDEANKSLKKGPF